MRINNNLMAMNAHRQLSINNDSVSKSLEKLSSGYRINRAGDDAAGLAISEKMRGQIRGLNMASKNAQDGISLIQTAEGALNESHSILQRMRELAVQSANDTNVEVDRGAIQKEMDQLSSELTRISNDTEFNTQKLLDGTFEGKLFHIGANQGQHVELGIDKMSAEALGVIGYLGSGVNVSGVAGVSVQNLTEDKVTIKYTALGDKDAEAVEKTTAEVSGNTITITLAQAAGDGSGAAGAITATKGDIVNALKSTGLVEVTVAEGTKLTDKLDSTTELPSSAGTTVSAGTASEDKGINVSSQKRADSAIKTINDAIERVSEERSKLGAMQNRLEHTIKNLDTSSENLQSAESRIRDVDMAKEMMEFTKQNILSQAANAMLAQANQAPQTVLQLLK
jgi:flagellin